MINIIIYNIKYSFKFDEIINYLWSVKILSDYSGTYLYQISIDKEEIISKAEMHGGSIPSVIELEKSIIVTCSYDHKIKIWKLET